MCYRSKISKVATFITTALLSVPVIANQDFQINGYAAQGMVKNKDSQYITNDDVSFTLTEVALNSSYQIRNDFRVAGQIVYLNGGNRYPEGGRIDYLLLDWDAYKSEHWNHSVYFGRVKNYHRLYSTARDVPMIRPTIILPQSAYLDALRDIGVSIDGIGIKSRYSDFEFGDLDLNLSIGQTDISDEQMELVVRPLA